MSLDELVGKGGSYMIELEHARQLLTMAAKDLAALKAGADGLPPAEDALLPVETALEALPSLNVSQHDAGRLARGQSVLVRGRDAPVMAGAAWAHFKGRILALGELEKGAFRPTRVFNFG